MRRKRKYRLIGLIYRLLFVRAGRDGPFFPFFSFLFIYLFLLYLFSTYRAPPVSATPCGRYSPPTRVHLIIAQKLRTNNTRSTTRH
jgi:hypothetical protein